LEAHGVTKDRKSGSDLALPRKDLFSDARATLEERLEAIKLSPEDEAKIRSDHLTRTIRDKFLGTFKLTLILKEFIDFEENLNKQINAAKKERLLGEYLEKCDNNAAGIHQLKEAICNPQGSTLINKIFRLLDDNPPDQELIDHLASVLKHIIETDFVRLFEEHKFALGQIEQLTPQALTVLADHRSWPPFHLGSVEMTGPRVTSEWVQEFAEAYANLKRITDDGIQRRLAHAIHELIGRGMLAAFVQDEERSFFRCSATPIGRGLIRYIG
jgi:hypothetical protein